MKTLKLLEKYPKTAKVINEWFTNKMMESMKDKSVPDEIKNFMKEKGVDNENLAKMIDANPRSLFDVFDANDIHIGVRIHKIASGKKQFVYSIYGTDNENTSSDFSRTKAELEIIEKAVKLLEKTL